MQLGLQFSITPTYIHRYRRVPNRAALYFHRWIVDTHAASSSPLPLRTYFARCWHAVASLDADLLTQSHFNNPLSNDWKKLEAVTGANRWPQPDS
jgi:hypothetical protein